MVKLKFALDSEGWDWCNIVEGTNEYGETEYTVNFYTEGCAYDHIESGFETFDDAFEVLAEILVEEYNIYPYVD